MEEHDPQIIDLDPDKAPRMTAIILLFCGLMGVGFLLVNIFFTGQDPYYIESEWDEGTEPVNQRFDITPNLLRGKHVEDSEEDDEANEIVNKKATAKKPASRPFGSPFQLSSPTPTTPGATTQRTPVK